MNITEISPLNLAFGYVLLIFPLGIMLWMRIPIVRQTLIAVLRMTLQLLFVGLYLQVVFKLNSPWLNGAWLLVMIVVADMSVARGCGLRLIKFGGSLFIALSVGTIIPLSLFMILILRHPNLMDAQYMIPIGGMILGNCLRSDIIGISSFFKAIRSSEKAFLQSLAQGAQLQEAVRPFMCEAIQAALMPMVATMATIGLVALPGMMTGVILGGADPMTAIKYQIAIMIAIFSGTAITVLIAIWLTIRSGFTAYGVLNRQVFKT